ncbi:hypothetical protein QCA50_009897 [Cerrena zonata]|uniref:Uncharacterized protein n=1 Tax=Cerrena zonata TaxID=2478898 RepID=A0AAW0G5Q9_9APHY
MVDETPDNETPLIDDETTPLIDETPALVNDESIDNYDEDAIRDEDDDSIESNPLMSPGDYLPQELKFPFRITGGFGWNSQEIGKLLSVNGFCGILVNINLFYFNGAFGSLAQGTAFPQIMMLIHRAAPIKYRSLVNSTNLSATSFLRFISPILFGKLMAVLDKLKLGGFPWIFISMVALGGFIQSLFLEEHDEDLKSIDV